MAETGDDDSMENGTFTNPAHQTSDEAFSLAMHDAEDSTGVPTSSNAKEAALPRPGVVHVSGAAHQDQDSASGLSQLRILGQSEDTKAVADPALASVASGTIDRPLRTSPEQVDAPLEPTYEFVPSSAMKKTPEQAPLAAKESVAPFDEPLRRSLQDLEVPAEPTLHLVQGPRTDDQGKASGPLSPTKRSKSSSAVRSPNRRDSGGDRPSRRADAKATLREEMNILKSRGHSQTPGAVAVTGVVSSGTAQAVARPDAKSALRAEVIALRQNHAASQAPGAVSVSGVISSGTARATPRGGGKAAIKQDVNPDAKSSLRAMARTDSKSALRAEVDALRQNHAASQAPGAVSIAGVVSSGTACATPRGNDKEAIKQEMNALRNNVDMQKPGAHSVSGTASSDGVPASRTDRASRKASRFSVSLKKDPSKKGVVADSEKGDVKQAPLSSGDQKPRAKEQRMDGLDGKAAIKQEMAALMEGLDGKAAIKQEMAALENMATTRGFGKERIKQEMEALENMCSEQRIEGVVQPSSDDMAGQSSDPVTQVSNEDGLAEENLGELEDENGMVSAQVVDEGELEAEYQANMMMNVVAAEVVTEDELKAQQRSGSRCRSICCPLILIAIVIAIVVPLTTKPDSAPAPTPSPTSLTDYEYLYNILYPISRDALLKETTPQFQALNWLAYEDPAMLPFKQSNSSTLVERYVAAVVYFSTGGAQWVNQMNFLSNHSICNWTLDNNGVLCHKATNAVTRITLSKWCMQMESLDYLSLISIFSFR
jgi:hypothetical protein